mmetsp:Transcript_110641/g.191786  ORF Transcript_110641/g.191786 Transcript_110641/m.191786 type:complete len:219 (+) Transcript_110641:472-1128(+)
MQPQCVQECRQRLHPAKNHQRCKEPDGKANEGKDPSSLVHAEGHDHGKIPEHLRQLSMGQRQGPQSEVRCCVGDATQNKFNCVDHLLDDHLRHIKGLVLFSSRMFIIATHLGCCTGCCTLCGFCGCYSFYCCLTFLCFGHGLSVRIRLVVLSKLSIRSVLVMQVLNHRNWNQQKGNRHKRTEEEANLHHVLKACTYKDVGICLNRAWHQKEIGLGLQQ